MSATESVPVRLSAPTEHPVHELIAGRWSPRSFDPERPVEEDKLRRIFEAARWAPSCFNEQPWEYNVFTVEERAALDKARQCLSAGNAWAERAPVLAFSITKKRFDHNGKNNRFSSYDAGQATLLAALQAVELGLVFHQMAGYSRKELEEHYPLPDGYAYKAAIAIGYPSAPPEVLSDAQRKEESERRPRRPQNEFVHFHGRGWN
jgi:nitroreductase